MTRGYDDPLRLRPASPGGFPSRLATLLMVGLHHLELNRWGYTFPGRGLEDQTSGPNRNCAVCEKATSSGRPGSGADVRGASGVRQDSEVIVHRSPARPAGPYGEGPARGGPLR